MGRKSRTDTEQELARRRADLIMQVNNRQLTATEAAAILGVSRKTYYEWEARGLEGLVTALENRGKGGRPAKPPDPEKDDLKERIRELEKQLKEQHVIIRLKEAIAEDLGLNTPAGKGTKTKKKKPGPPKP